MPICIMNAGMPAAQMRPYTTHCATISPSAPRARESGSIQK